MKSCKNFKQFQLGNYKSHSSLPDWNVDADELATAEVMTVQRNFQEGTLDF